MLQIIVASITLYYYTCVMKPAMLRVENLKGMDKITIWPDHIRLSMVDKQDVFYRGDKTYGYGYYDGFQKCIEELLKKGISSDALITALNGKEDSK